MVITINLVIRFFLEMLALGIFAYWGRQQAEGLMGFMIALFIPLFAAGLWSTFAVLDDPSRSGKAPVPVSGKTRIGVELAFWLLSALALFNTEYSDFGSLYLFFIVLNNILLRERNSWLWKQPKGQN
jgi:hypothetical protein